ncbi:hypothetical protein [Streptomyces nogalater]|uniref:Uncharacterized protein n=1 Tax=Streptomyces nogalater TaxID=38314 RepID=A0ABW0WPX0_STRNO
MSTYTVTKTWARHPARPDNCSAADGYRVYYNSGYAGHSQARRSSRAASASQRA